MEPTPELFQLGPYHLGALRRARDTMAREANRLFQAGDMNCDFWSGDAEALDELRVLVEKVIHHAENHHLFTPPTRLTDNDTFPVRVVPAVLQAGGEPDGD